jgi:LuxR family maltose regulon positive regulatory protein
MQHSHMLGNQPVAVLPSLHEELSQREMEVLWYLPSMLTAAEIGAELYVSVNTVKAHLRSIYRKLGATRRREAVVQAHRYGILKAVIPQHSDYPAA